MAITLLRTTSEVNETTRRDRKKMMQMANEQPGTGSHPEEVLDKRAKVKPAHRGPRTASHHEEALGGRKKRMSKAERPI